MNKLFLIPLLILGSFGPHFASLRADEETLQSEIDVLQTKLIVAEERIAKLETVTSLLMAAYSLKAKEQAELEERLRREHRPLAPILDQPPSPPSMVSP